MLNQAVYVPVSFPGGAAMLRRHKAQLTKRISCCLYVLTFFFFFFFVLGIDPSRKNFPRRPTSAAEVMERSPEKSPVDKTDNGDLLTPASGDGYICNHKYWLFIMKNFTPQPRVRWALHGSRLDSVTARRLGLGREPIKLTPPRTDCLLTLCAHSCSGGGQCFYFFLLISPSIDFAKLRKNTRTTKVFLLRQIFNSEHRL